MALTENPAGCATDGVLANIKAAELDEHQYNQTAKKIQVLDGSSRHETAYKSALCFGRSGLHRVIRCSDDLQYVVQERTGTGRWPWRAQAYVISAAQLPAVLQRPSLGIPSENVAALFDQLAGVPA
ncbi:MAG: hypothetical protein AAFR84_16820 [Pseudomonadota bacterium]